MNDKWVGSVVKVLDDNGANVSASLDGVQINTDSVRLTFEPAGARCLATLLVASAEEVERLRKERV